jgi:hypothetical protein
MYSYWNCELWAEGIAHFSNEEYITDLQMKWNIIGLPDNNPVHKNNITVFYNATLYTWQDAINQNIILGFIYQWNETTQNYEATDILSPGKACWMYAYEDCSLLKPT